MTKLKKRNKKGMIRQGLHGGGLSTKIQLQLIHRFSLRQLAHTQKNPHQPQLVNQLTGLPPSAPATKAAGFPHKSNTKDSETALNGSTKESQQEPL